MDGWMDGWMGRWMGRTKDGKAQRWRPQWAGVKADSVAFQSTGGVKSERLYARLVC